jgi:hypothetical protein
VQFSGVGSGWLAGWLLCLDGDAQSGVLRRYSLRGKVEQREKENGNACETARKVDRQPLRWRG